MDILLRDIDPCNNFDQLSARANQAIDSFRLESGIVDKWDKFIDIMAEFYCHVDCRVLNTIAVRKSNYDYDWDRCISLLKKQFGPQGDKAAFEIAKTGVEGGVYGLLKTIAGLMIDDYAEREISARVGVFWSELTVDQQIASPQEYIEKHERFISPELKEGGAVRIRANFRKVLEEHPRLIRRLRRLGKGS